MKVHMIGKWTYQFTWSLCGIIIDRLESTDDIKLVTCEKCKKIIKNKPNF